MLIVDDGAVKKKFTLRSRLHKKGYYALHPLKIFSQIRKITLNAA